MKEIVGGTLRFLGRESQHVTAGAGKLLRRKFSQADRRVAHRPSHEVNNRVILQGAGNSTSDAKAGTEEARATRGSTMTESEKAEELNRILDMQHKRR